MGVILFKWGFVLGLIVLLVVGFSSKQIRTPVIAFARKFWIQILIITATFVALITYSQLGT